LSVLDLPLLITPLVSFGHCIVSPWFTTSYYPFGIFWPLYCLSLIYHFLLPLWYLLATVLSVLDLPLLITPLVSVGHCVVCPWFTTSYYPFVIFWPLYCLSLIYHFLLPLWYLLAIVLSVLDLPLLITPLVSSNFSYNTLCHMKLSKGEEKWSMLYVQCISLFVGVVTPLSTIFQ
jgi:hypothetical protein